MNIKINNMNINYEVEGEGNPLIIFHGWLASSETMMALQHYLSKSFKVYNVDVIGFGKSDLPKEPMHINDFGDFIKNFINALNIKNPILVGHSNGGNSIINYAGRNLGKVEKIVLFGSTGVKRKVSLKTQIKIYTFKFLKKISNIIPGDKEKRREKLLKKFGSSDYSNSPEILRKTMSNVLNEPQEKIMPNIKAPVLLIYGENDTATPVEYARRMEKLMPNAGVVVVKNAGHFSFLEQPGFVYRVLDSFLGGESK